VGLLQQILGDRPVGRRHDLLQHCGSFIQALQGVDLLFAGAPGGV